MMDDDTQAATQKLTQDEFEPRRRTQYRSGLSEEDASDVFCVLVPASRAAIEIVEHTARTRPQHVLHNHGMRNYMNNATDPNHRERDASDSADSAQELALRFSSEVIDPVMGFCFGRNREVCDINLDAADIQKRVSNKHFRIYINQDGILMLEDLSSNGTIVDNATIGGKVRKGNHPKTHMLRPGSIIEVLLDSTADVIKFLLSIPQRTCSEAKFMENFQNYMDFQAVAARRKERGLPMPVGGAKALFSSQNARFSKSKSTLNPLPPGMNTNYGMHWTGGDNFTCTGIVGKGAFATVYQIATTWSGELYAAKELEKKRFIRNGVLDTRLANELKIMKALRHPHIVDYIDYVETDTHLYIIMEYVRYGDLQSYMEPKGQEMRTLPEDLGREMAGQILTALAYLHDQNITHRDIKPDNILICSEEPFVVKLTDFGLSKMVNDAETFLKTFCGTLLYCAPEVFPYYGETNPPKRLKRRRNDNRRSYSQLVDIWSFAAVLWYVLSGKPAFEGITDGNGRAMFERIMDTPLDTTPLKEKGISEQCIDLLLGMLNIDPNTRPSEVDCLHHPWLLNGDYVTQDAPMGRLADIAEGDESLDCSQLSLQDHMGQDFVESDSLDITREAKRQRGESFYAVREHTEVPSSSEGGSSMFAPLLNDTLGNAQLLSLPDGPVPISTPTPISPHVMLDQRPMSVLRSSGVFGSEMAFVSVESPRMDIERGHDRTVANTTNVIDYDESFTDLTPISPSDAEMALERAQFEPPAPPTPALDRAQQQKLEAMVRDLKMVSPETSVTGQDVDMTPKAPHVTRFGVTTKIDETSQNQHRNQNQTPKEQTTPKPNTFTRLIKLPLPPSFFFEPSDPSTHNLEYASRMMSRYNFLGESTTTNTAAFSMPANTGVASITSSSADSQYSPNKENESTLSPPLSIPDFPLPSIPAFTKPSPVYGKLTSTPSSFAAITLNLTQRHTTWGRNPHNTIVYKDAQDTRVAKIGLELWFHAPNLDEMEQKGVDWTTLENLHVIVATHSSRGILVNGVKLPDRDESGRKCYGRLYTGDEICVSSSGDGKGLRFLCEFSLGKSARRRRAMPVGDGRARFVVEVAGDVVGGGGGSSGTSHVNVVVDQDEGTGIGGATASTIVSVDGSGGGGNGEKVEKSRDISVSA